MGRVEAGDTAQQKAYGYLVSRFPSLELVSYAKKYVRDPDLVVRLGGKLIQCEVKSISSENQLIALVEKSIRCGDRYDIFDAIVSEITRDEIVTLSNYIKWVREKDTTVGFPGEDGVARSGKVPPCLKVTDGELLQTVRRLIIRHLVSVGNDLLCLYNVKTDEVIVYSLRDCCLNCQRLPKFQKVSFGTYGASKSGAMRVALKVRMDFSNHK